MSSNLKKSFWRSNVSKDEIEKVESCFKATETIPQVTNLILSKGLARNYESFFWFFKLYYKFQIVSLLMLSKLN